MKTLTILITALIGTNALAQPIYIGETRDCEVKAKVIAHHGSLLVIHERQVDKLKKTGIIAGLTQYQSVASDLPLGKPTFSAQITSPEMSRLSVLTIYLSGRYFSCSIEP